MAKYSNKSDMKDELIRQYSKESDHAEAEEYVDKVLANIGIKSMSCTPFLKQLSVTYATYKRAFYEAKSKDDVFFQKYLAYEKELKMLTKEITKLRGE